MTGGVARPIVGVLGAVYALIGLAGFAVTGGTGFADPDGDLLLGIFEINPLHNVVHLGIGVALLASLMGANRIVAGVAGTIGVVYILVAVAGPFVTGTDANILALNTADHWLHVLTGVVLLFAAWDAARRPAVGPTDERRHRPAG